MCSQAEDTKPAEPAEPVTTEQPEDERRACEEWRELIAEIRMTIDL